MMKALSGLWAPWNIFVFVVGCMWEDWEMAHMKKMACT